MKTDRIKLMSEAPVSKALFQLGIPMVISMLVTALYNVVDTYFVSGLGKQAVAAVSVAFPISLIFSGIGLTFGARCGFLYLPAPRKKGQRDGGAGGFYRHVQ